MIGLEGEYLVVGLVRDALARVRLLVEAAGLVRDRRDILEQGPVRTQQVSVFLPHDIDLPAETPVTALQL